MLAAVIEFFKQRTSGERALVLIGCGIGLFVIGIWTGRLAHALFGA